MPSPFALCLKCGPHMRRCLKASRGTCEHPKVHFPNKKSYEAEKTRRAKNEKSLEKEECDFFAPGAEGWRCFEDDWMD